MKILDTNIEVAACPVCGTEAFLHTNRTSRGNSQFWPKCDNLQCGCTINAGKDREEVLARWNRRSAARDVVQAQTRVVQAQARAVQAQTRVVQAQARDQPEDSRGSEV